jgi:PAS domain S-box-containing protein
MNLGPDYPERHGDKRVTGAIGALWDLGGNGGSPASRASDVSAQTVILLLTSLMDGIPDRIYFKDVESRFILVNRAMAAACGAADPAELTAKTDFDIFTEEHARAAREDEKRVMETGQALIGKEEKETWRNGRITWCSTTKMPLYDGNGRVAGTFGITRDITEWHLAQEALKESEERYRQLLSAEPSYTYAVQFEEGRPVHTRHSAGCQGVTGYTAFEFGSDPFLWIKMVHPDDHAAVRDHIDQVMTGGRCTPIEHRIRRKDGSTCWIRNASVAHHDASGKVVSYDGLVEDITERKLVEAELQRTLAELERRVEERTAELAQVNKARMQFVFDVSHELKTPLVSLRHAVANMLKGITGPVSPKQTEYLALMQRGLVRLSSALQEILDVGRIEANAMVLNRSRMVAADLVRQAVEPLELVAEQKSVALSISHDGVVETVEWDGDKMGRVILNVVENAIKFTLPGGSVEVSLRKDPSRSDFLLLAVTDNGVGIKTEHLGHIMERYYRADESIPGVGLGLSICRDVVRLHGGEMDLASPPPGRERGTQVTIRLPVSVPPSAT